MFSVAAAVAVLYLLRRRLPERGIFSDTTPPAALFGVLGTASPSSLWPFSRVRRCSMRCSRMWRERTRHRPASSMSAPRRCPRRGPPDPGGAFPKVVQSLEIVGSATPRGTLYLASNVPPTPHYWIWQIEPMCDVQGGDCAPGGFCSGADQGVYMDINVKPLAQAGDPNPVAPPPAPGRTTGFLPPLPGTRVGTEYGGWLSAGQGCVGVS